MTTNIVNVFEPAQFGVGDGATTEFQIGGPREVVTSITPTGVWRQDWQGNQRLYPTPRTNHLRYSEDVSGPGWNRVGATVELNAALAPDGTMTAAKVVTTTVLESHSARNSVSSPAGSEGFQSIYVKAAGYNFARLESLNYAAQAERTTANVNLLTGELSVNGTSPVGGVDALPDGWFRIWVRTLRNSDIVGTTGFAVYPNNTLTGTASFVGDGVGGIYVWGAQIEYDQGYTSYIATSGAAQTVTDFALSDAGLFTMGQAPAIGASLTWTGSYTYEYQDDAPTLADRTVISQYANSPTLRQLIRNMDEYINPDTDFDAFYDYVWNVETAQGFGLDIWGRIVGVGRMLTIPGDETFLGYNEALNWQPFNQAPMYTGVQTSQTYRLADDAYRKLILVKALANISDCTSPSLNRLLTNLFAGRGRCYVSDTGKMEFRYMFEFALEPYEIAILTRSGAIPKPAGVLSSLLQVDVPTTFGFNEAVMQPFGSGVFFTSSGLIHASQ
ncbi:DUF2612 domain-containing protein [Achromobacter pulmonis]|nr:DUF2612 domain-containing protein [Achromobacter pulmonis]